MIGSLMPMMGGYTSTMDWRTFMDVQWWYFGHCSGYRFQFSFIENCPYVTYHP